MNIVQRSFRLVFWILFLGFLGFAFGLLFGGVKNKAAVLDTGLAVPSSITVKPFQDQALQQTVPKGSQYVSLFRFFAKADQETVLNQLGFYQTLGVSSQIARAHLAVQGKFIRETPLQIEKGFLSWDQLQIPMLKNKQLFFEVFIDLKKDIPDQSFLSFELRENDPLKLQTPIKSHVQVSSFLADEAIVKNSTTAVKIPSWTAKDQTIAKFTIKAGNHDLIIKRIRLRQAELIEPGRLSNVRLISGKVLTKEKTFPHDQTLDFSIGGVVIKKKKERNFSIMADVKDAWKTEHLRFFLGNPADLFVEDLEFGSGALVNNQFGFDTAWCVGVSSTACPKDGFRRKCTKNEIELKVRDC